MEAIIGKEFPKVVIPLIDQAKSTIKIVVFDWRWYPDQPGNPVQLFNQAIVRALRRGVQVLAVVNNGHIANTLKTLGAEAKQLTSQNLVHVKLMLIDNETVILGSHNYTQSAFTMNLELSALLYRPPCIGRLILFFDNLWSGNA